MIYTYRIADLNIGISSLHDTVHRLCAGYRVPSGAADFTVRTEQADIDFEREKSAREDELEGVPVRQFPDGYLETLAVYRKIAERMPEYDTVLFHGSCVAVDGAGYLFTARSGTGKSTHTRLWRELLGECAVMVNDDKPLIRMTGGGAVVYGTPWDGKHRLSANITVPLRAVCLLERAPENSIRSISPAEAYPLLLQQVYRPAGGDAMNRTLTLIDRMAAAVHLWRLSCNTRIDAAQLAYNTMKE